MAQFYGAKTVVEDVFHNNSLPNEFADLNNSIVRIADSKGLSGAALERAVDIYQYEFEHGLRRKLGTLYAISGLAGLGLILILLPALETVLHVMFLDISGLLSMAAP